MPTKPPPHARKAEKFKDGQKKAGGAGAARHAGPGRTSKTASARKRRVAP